MRIIALEDGKQVAKEVSLQEISSSGIENIFGLTRFHKSLLELSNSSVEFGICCIGDSVASDISSRFVTNLTRYSELSNLHYPGAFSAELLYSFTGVVPYGPQAGTVVQSIKDGKISASLQSSNNTITVTCSQAHFLTVGKYVTIDSGSFAGTYLVDAVVSTTIFRFAKNIEDKTETANIYGGIADFTYLPDARHIELAEGATATFDTNQNTGFSKFKVFLGKNSQFGNVTVELINRDTNATEYSITVNTNATQIGATHVDIIADITKKYKIKVSGKCIILGIYSVRSSSIIAVNFARGASTITQNCYSNIDVFKYLVNQLNIGLVFIEAKEENLPNSLNLLSNRLNQISASKLVVGSSPDARNLEPVISENELFREMARTNNYSYFDTYKVFGSYANLLSNNLQGDGTHIADYAKDIATSILMSNLGIEFLFKQTKLDVNHFGTRAKVVTNKVNFVGALNNEIVGIEAWGAGDPAKLHYKNGRMYSFGQSENAYTGIAPYGTNGVASVNQNSTAVRHLVQDIFTSSSVQSSFDNLKVGGSTENAIKQETTTMNLFIAHLGGKSVGLRTQNTKNNLIVDPNGCVAVTNVTKAQRLAIVLPTLSSIVYQISESGIEAEEGWYQYKSTGWSKIS